jgi:hypothetical protein
MAPSEQARSARTRQTSRVARGVTAALVAVVFVVLAFGIAQRASGAARADTAGVVSVPGVSGRISLAARTRAANPFVPLPEPLGHRRIALGDVCLSVAAVAAAYLFFKRASLGASRRLRFEGVFPLRRGPPTRVVAH